MMGYPVPWAAAAEAAALRSFAWFSLSSARKSAQSFQTTHSALLGFRVRSMSSIFLGSSFQVKAWAEGASSATLLRLPAEQTLDDDASLEEGVAAVVAWSSGDKMLEMDMLCMPRGWRAEAVGEGDEAVELA